MGLHVQCAWDEVGRVRVGGGFAGTEWLVAVVDAVLQLLVTLVAFALVNHFCTISA